VIYCDIFWYILIYSDIFWYILIYSDIFWHILIYSDIFCLSVHRWCWHKHQLFSNARPNLTLSDYYIVLALYYISSLVEWLEHWLNLQNNQWGQWYIQVSLRGYKGWLKKNFLIKFCFPHNSSSGDRMFNILKIRSPELGLWGKQNLIKEVFFTHHLVKLWFKKVGPGNRLDNSFF
jgi:hypothetical protein